MYSARKIKYHNYIERKEPIANSLSFSEPRRNNILLKKQNSDFILPLIIQNKKINESYNEAKLENNDFISTSGMINRKRLNKHKKNKITINALYNIIKNKKELMEDDYRSFDNIYNMNEKYNLNLNLKENNNDSYINSNGKKRKLTKNGLLAYLFHKYSSVNNNKVYNHKKPEEKVDKDDYSSNVSFDLGKDDNNNNNSGAEQTFLTKLKINNDNIDISKIMNRHNYLIWSIKKNNHKIIDKDKNIYINCLLSNVQNELNRDKILYKNNGKTIYELDKELSYKRLKKFENIINKFIEKDKSYILSKKKLQGV